MQYPDFAALCDDAYLLIEQHQRTGDPARLLEARRVVGHIEEATRLMVQLLTGYGDRLPPAYAAALLGAMQLMREVTIKFHLYLGVIADLADGQDVDLQPPA